MSISTETLKYASWCILGVTAVCIFFILLQHQTNPLQIKPLILHAKLCLDKSKQDTSPIFSLQHAAEGLAYIQVCRKLASDSKIQELTGTLPSTIEELFLEKISHVHSSLSKTTP